MPTIVSIAISRVRSLGVEDAPDPMDRPWKTGFFKEAVSGTVRLTAEGLIGDEQADRVNHGGIDKAILAYSADHYADWRRQLSLPELPFGAFGENLTIQDLSETNVCIGDVWSSGDAQFEVSQPRQPCWKLARRWRLKSLPADVIKTGRTGWYLRVLKLGDLMTGQGLTLVRRPNPAWTIAKANDVMHFDKYDAELARELAGVPGLSFSWQETLWNRG
jgi:MOSC domain-containing protein YiiM